MSFATGDSLLPTNTRDDRGATTAAALRSSLVAAPTLPRGAKRENSSSWGASREKMAYLDPYKVAHRHSEHFRSIFEARAPKSGDSPSPGKTRRAFMAATGYNGSAVLGWKPLPGPAVDLPFWAHYLTARGYYFDFVWDELKDPSSRPTKNNILLFLRRLAQSCNPGDEVVIVFSGHGEDSAYIPVDCPNKSTTEAIYPADLRAAFVNLLPSNVAILVVWDTCNAFNPFGLSQKLDVGEGSITFKPTGLTRNDKDISMVLISASSGRTKEVELNKEPEKVQCGPLCWAFFAYVLCRLKDNVETPDIMKSLIEHIRSSFEDQEDMVPQFLCSTYGPNVPTEISELLASLLTAYHRH